MPWNAITNLASDYGFPSALILMALLITKLYFRYRQQVDETRTFKKEELTLLSETLSSSTSKPNKIFLYEQLFELKYGKPISWREISYLMKTHSPSDALALYSDSSLCITFPIDADKPEFRGSFKSSRYRKFRSSWNVFWYFTFSLLGLFALWATPWIFVNLNAIWASTFLSAFLILIVSAGFCLRGYGQIIKAERLMELIDYSESNPNKFNQKNYLLF